MTRHGRNATASAVYSYSERKKDSASSGYGTLQARLGAESVKPFDCCCLSLQPCKQPMISPDGYIFDKESVLKYILHRKDMYKLEMEAYEHHLKILNEKDDAKKKELEEDAKKKFMHCARHLVNTSTDSGSTVERIVDVPSGPSGGVTKKTVDKKNIQAASFWGPNIPECLSNAVMEKPDKTVRNPYNNKPLKYKDLLPVIFTPLDETLSHSQVVGSQHRYMCPVTRDILTNSMKSAYLKTSSRVINAACVDMLLKDGNDPINGKELKKEDVIYLQRGGTGFARTNMLKATSYRPSMATA